MIKITQRGLPEFQAFIRALPRGVKVAAARAWSTYIVGDERHGLSHEPERVTHDENNPYTWTTPKQRSAFFASDGFGRGIPSVRTHDVVNSWIVEENNSDWSRVKILNTAPESVWVVGDNQQIGHKIDGWQHWALVVASNTAGALRAASQAVERWIKAHSK